MALPSSVLPRQLHLAIKRNHDQIQVSPRLIRAASALPAEVLSEFETRAEGLTEEEAQARLDEFGPNVVADEARFTRLKLLVKACLNPLVILPSVLATISFATAQTTSDDVSGMLMVIRHLDGYDGGVWGLFAVRGRNQTSAVGV
jgi:P-type Mg2+ transporter